MKLTAALLDSIDLLSVSVLLSTVLADSYLHNPRGSNNKLNEQSNNVNNDRRLFDSQNNGNSGYQVGDACVPNCLTPGTNTYNPATPGAGQGTMQFYEGSYLTVEWTNQHGSGSPFLHNQFVMQYMCDDIATPLTAVATNSPPLPQGTGLAATSTTGTGALYSTGMRNGITTEKIPLDQNDPNIKNFGQHETAQYWQQCLARERNGGLYAADQNLPANARATNTRQDTNNNNNRYGFECPEERDYYPYWHPTPWRDIMVCTDTPSQCPYYKENSQNVVDKGNCTDPQYNNQKDCETRSAKWIPTGNWNIPPPNCTICPTTRNNHNGESLSAASPSYTWQIPTGVHADGAKCVLRLRYNVTTYDFTDHWNVYASSNGANAPVKNNPTRDWVGLGLNVSGPLRLAMDTSQFGRTFEDRTHIFQIRKRPAVLPCGIRTAADCAIYNLNVRGRRGNIQQTYPAVEYDFVPGTIVASRNDYLHIQWTGADSNDQNNAGQGRAGTDRNNLVVVGALGKNVPVNLNPTDRGSNWQPLHFTNNNGTIAYMAFLNQTECNDAQTNTQADDNCKVINRAPGYVNVGLVQIDNTGTFYLMSTRNNAFTNREQKSKLIVSEDAATVAGSIAVSFTGIIFFAGLAFIGLLYARKHPESKLNKLYGTNKPIETAEFDDDEIPGVDPHVMPPAKPSLLDRVPMLSNFAEWYAWNKPRVLFLTFFALSNIAVYAYGYISNIGGSKAPYFPYAKGFGKMLDINLAFILVPVMRNFLSFLRSTPVAEHLPLDDNINIHQWTAYTTLFAAAGHMTLHYLNFVWFENNMAIPIYANAIGTLPGFTGHIVAFMMLLMFATAMIKRKVSNVFGKRFDGYRVFLSVHKLWIPIYALLWLHGSVFWQFTLIPLMFTILEKYIQSNRVKLDVKIIEAKMVGKDVLGLKMMLVSNKKKFRYKAGQYLFLCCPDISVTEYHPFTITSAPEDSYFSVHIRCRSDMDWTYRLRQRTGFAESTDAEGKTIAVRNVPVTEENAHDSGLPLMRVDGPFGSASEEVFEYDTVLLVGAGIGVTPFISILKSISMRIKARIGDNQNDAMKIYFYWICRDQGEFDSFKDLFDQMLQIKELTSHLELNMYVTGEMNLKNVKVERYNQYSGKPNWNRIFKDKATKHAGQDIGVFLCGPAPIGQELQKACKAHSTKRITSVMSGATHDTRTKFRLHKENF